jgi:hypothetical protein
MKQMHNRPVRADKGIKRESWISGLWCEPKEDDGRKKKSCWTCPDLFIANGTNESEKQRLTLLCAAPCDPKQRV